MTYTNFGLGGVYTIVYVSLVDLFPIKFRATAFGLCNLGSKLFTSTAPQVAELSEPTPLLIYLALNVFGILVVYLL